MQGSCVKREKTHHPHAPYMHAETHFWGSTFSPSLSLSPHTHTALIASPCLPINCQNCQGTHLSGLCFLMDCCCCRALRFWGWYPRIHWPTYSCVCKMSAPPLSHSHYDRKRRKSLSENFRGFCPHVQKQ